MEYQRRSQRPLKMFIYQPVYLSAKAVAASSAAKENIAPEQDPEQEVNEAEKPKKVRPKESKYVCSTITEFPYFPVKKSDVFTSEKRPADYFKLEKQSEFKVAAIRYNLREGACIVFLENITFDDEKELKRFVSDNSRV